MYIGGRLYKKISDMKISVRFTLFYCVILISSILLSNILYQKIYSNTALKKVSDMSVQTLYSVKTSLDLMISNIDNCSKMILSNDDLQLLLRNGNIYSDLRVQARLGTYLNKLTQETSFISSVYIFDNCGNEYSINNQDDLQFIPPNIQDVDWYDLVVQKKGAYILKLNGGNIFRNTPKDNFVSMIRLIRDINSTKTLGVLIINISENAFKDSYSSIINNYTTGVTILDENHESIIKLNVVDKSEIKNVVESFENSKHGYMMKKLKDMEYLFSYLVDKRSDWKIISIMPAKELSNETAVPGLIGFAIILINSLLMFIGTILTSRIITIPIKKLLKSMKGIQKGKFKEVDIRTGNNEIGQLKDGYNMMIYEIQQLIDRVITEQRIKRKAELNVLQAQIKPHFLYNTLESINSLILMEETEAACNIVDALGSYYRLSLSKGKEVITIGEEIEIVKNYLNIQQIRYADLFSVHYKLDERAGNFKILKLVLQPLVENALYHGIRVKGEHGIITIETEYLEDHIRITVEDDGVGMSEECIRRILDNSTDTEVTSFGLRGTIERLRIFYGVDDCFRIESVIGFGTKITILIPISSENGEEKYV
ncbi:MAG TPA: sensor histidine kinase [Pseudobacteroides sp.]|uniref:sensor histidine kinase n=1 Tax=Pseudobacteroides sp. TaxID=1968840 RepID=UPI002F9222DE